MTIMEHPIKHLAITMDGNGRWAKSKGISTAEGHKKGAIAAKNLLPAILELNIPYLTLYAFSAENWQRSEKEVAVLINLLNYYLQQKTSVLIDNGIRLKIIGRLDKLSPLVQKKINEIVELTKNNDKMTLCLAFSYGGRLEIIDACQKIINAGKSEINEEEFKNYLYDPEMPDVDLLIRTSGVKRVSNFLLWQIAYAELYFTNKYWPDFDKADLIEAINDYSTRKRNFGGR